MSELQTYSAKIIRIIEEKEIDVMGSPQLYQKLELAISAGDKKGQTIILENGDQPLANVVRYKTNDRVLVSTSIDHSGNPNYYIADFIRTDGLFLLFTIFIILTALVAKLKGLTSILSMAFTFLILFIFVLPQISQGRDPVIIASLSSIVIIPVTFYLSHGLNRKTTAAIVGSVISLIITAILASVFVYLTHLTGLSSEEAGMVSINSNGLLNMKGLLLAGIVIGALGVLDDITISQAAVVQELSLSIKPKDLYSHAMHVGKDHIASMVNTLVLAYAGASLPLLLIFINNPQPFSQIINYEMIAEEIVRTLIGSIGLILAVPVTTLLASRWCQESK